jgi:N6-adenosine-specific RNA methylase IME4
VTWDGLTPPYATIVADPPWYFHDGSKTLNGRRYAPRPAPYSMLQVDEIAALPVADLAGPDADLYLWTTNRYLRDAFKVATAWGFKPKQTLVWCKPPKGVGPGGAFCNSAEFILFCTRGQPARKGRVESTWFLWSRHGGHSTKPSAFGDVVETVSPGPYVELFARAPRLGWDAWGHGYEVAS